MSKKEKVFKNLDDQIKILKKRGLHFISEGNAKKHLLEYSYYNIINGYKDLFVECTCDDEREEIYKDGVTFERIFELYKFDKELRRDVMSSMLEVEEHLKAAVAYVVAEKFGHLEKDYMKFTNYRPGKRYKDKSGRSTYKLNDLIFKFKKVTRDDVHPMKYYRETYQNVPPWILVKGLSFGNLVNFVKLMKPPEKVGVFSILFGIPTSLIDKNEDLKRLYMDILYQCLAYRNWAAHGGRMYNYFSSKSEIKFSSHLHDDMGVTEADYRNNIGKSGICTLYHALKLFSNKEMSLHLLVGLSFLFSEYENVFPEDIMMIKHEMQLSVSFMDSLINFNKEEL